MATAPTLDRAAVARKDAALEARLRRWAARADALVGREVSAAHAHAAKALTDAMRSAPEGRATLAKARNNPSAKAAAGHLAGLVDALADLVADARESLYRDARLHWAALAPSDTLNPAVDPAGPAAAVARARNLVLFGRTPRMGLAGPVAIAASALQANLARSGSRATPATAGPDLLAAWARSSADAISRAAFGQLTDSLEPVAELALRDVCRPELFHENPGLPD